MPMDKGSTKQVTEESLGEGLSFVSAKMMTEE